MSVVVPCYNYGHFLEAAVKSVVSQHGVDVDVLVIDDASPDGSASVGERLAASYEQVTLLRHTVNAGHIRTYNEGLSQARSTYVLLLSADDLLAPGALARAASVMEALPSVGLVYGFAPAFHAHTPRYVPRPHRWRVWPGQEWIDRVCRSARNPVITPTALMRRSVLEDVGSYDMRLRHSADFLMWLRTADVVDVAHLDGAVQGYYRQHALNMHATEWDGELLDVQTRLELFDVFFQERPQWLSARLAGAARDAVLRDAMRMVRMHLSRPHEGPTQAGELLELVLRTSDAPDLQAQAQALCRRLQGPLVPRPVAAVRSAAYDLRGRAAWQYWRRYGLHV